jgi:hypothetical protein
MYHQRFITLKIDSLIFLYICTVHPAVTKAFYYQLMQKSVVFKEVLKFALKLQYLKHVSVWSPSSSGRVICELTKAHIVRSLMMVITPKYVGAIVILM